MKYKSTLHFLFATSFLVCAPFAAAHADSGASTPMANAAQSQAPGNETAAPPPVVTPASPANEVQEIVVTGSRIKRANIETASPVQVITATDLKQSGYTTISQVLENITANGAGTLSNNNSEAFAGGASGIALRGLSVGDTLVLVDGHRLAPYPLSDDGERQFTDVQSIPFDAVDHVEILKDGASSIYGSDALAGVVNIILKKSFTGFTGTAEAGNTQHGGGETQHLALTFGKGSLRDDGYNAYISVEYRHQDPIYLSQRSYQDWSNLDFSSLGGLNLSPGAVNILNSGLAATLTPYFVNAAGSLNSPSSYAFLGSGCNYAAMEANQCTYKSPAVIQQPTQNLNILTSFTKDFAGGWELNVKASLFDSQGQQSNGYSTYPGDFYGGLESNPIGGFPALNVGAQSFELPATYPGNTTGGAAYLEGVIPQVGISTIHFDSKTYRFSADLSGKLEGWDVSADIGASQVDTHSTFDGFVNYDNLYAALVSGAFNPVGGNSQAAISNVAPQFYATAVDTLAYLELHATRPVIKTTNFDLAVATGFETIYKDLNNPSAPQILSGEVGGTFSTYAIGSQTDVAGYVELDANVFKQVELSAAARYDYYNTYGSSVTPKFGVKWRPNKFVAVRGTYSQGFRAPTAAESGLSSELFGLALSFPDPILCGSTNGLAAGQVPSSCATSPGFVQRTNALKPETSTSETGGIIFEPIKGWVSTLDFYNIEIDNQIITAAELPSFSLSNCLRGAALPTTISDGNGGQTTGTPLAGPILLCTSGYVNAQSTKTNGLDFDTTYTFDLPWHSKLAAGFSYTYVLTYDLTAPNGVTYHLAGTHGPDGVSGDTGNPRERMNAHATFSQGPLDVTLTANRIGSYNVTDPSALGNLAATCQGALLTSTADFAGASSAPTSLCNVKAFTTLNLSGAYKVGSHLTFTGSITNLLDANAPRDFQTYGGSFIPFNPALHMDGIVGRFFMLGLTYKY
jgi:iron complex outermembrane receptor protein